MSSSSSTVKSLSTYNQIRELILQGSLLPGTRLVLSELEQKLNVGRGPIREAIMRLDRTGLIQNIPYKGAVVAPLPTFRELKHIYDVRAHIECILAREAMELASDKDYGELESIINQLNNTQGNNFFQYDRAFHSTINKIAKMPHLSNIASSLVDLVEIFLNNKFYGIQDQELLMEQHQNIFISLKNKDENALCTHLKENILIGLNLIQQEMTFRGKTVW